MIWLGSTIRFRLDAQTFRPNQDATLDFSNSICRCTVNQTSSTPGMRLKNTIELSKGDYELVITARASKPERFFLWVYDNNSNTRIGGTLHIGEDTEKVALGFSIQQTTDIDIGVLVHNHDIGDHCDVEFVEIRRQAEHNVSIKPLSLEPNQSAILSNHSEHWEIIANQNRSTPGGRLSIPVTPGALHAISVEVEVISVSAAAFLWAYSRQEERELLPRVHVFQGGPDATKTRRTVYVQIPEGVTEILLGVLFSSAGLKSSDSFKLYSLDIEEITTLGDVVDAGYVLNLEEEQEKFEYCRSVLEKEGFKPERAIAVNGASVPFVDDYNQYSISPYNAEDLRLGRKAIQSPGAWGYLLTMKNILTDAIEKGYNSIAVFDDDIILTHDFTLKFSRFMRRIPAEWDVLMLGASQWNWTGVKLDEHAGWYLPNNVTNGSFAMIYHCNVFGELIDAIEKMDSPFDSTPLKSVTCNSKRKGSYVAWPNIIVADVEKEGIRDSRSQTAYASRFRWKMQDFPDNYKRWRTRTVKIFEKTPKNWPQQNLPSLAIGVTTINRWSYLEKFLNSWQNTRNNSFNWTIIIADDGSTDGTIEKLVDYKIPNANFVLLQNNGSGIATQTNSIFNYVLQMETLPDLIFSSDDDIFFKKRGWDSAYFEAAKESGYHHLVHFNPDWKKPEHVKEISVNSTTLSSMTNGVSCMGCFYTVTPKLLEEVGGFDQQAFPIRGHSHIDFTMRACRKGFNDQETLCDILHAPEFIGIHPKEGYVPTFRRYSFKEQMTMADPKDKARRWSLIKDEKRTYIHLDLYEAIEPESYHFSPSTKSEKNAKEEGGADFSLQRDLYQKLHDIPHDSHYNHLERWSMQGRRLVLNYNGIKTWWQMPPDYSMELTHPDLFKVAEFVLLSPFEPDLLNDWIPSRKPGIRPGLAFSAGCDSTAAMELLPEQTVLMYHKRSGFESQLNHSNALRFISYLEDEIHRPVFIVESNHELLRTLDGKQPGFVTDYACAVHVILLADYFQLDSIATGMPLENSFLWHGQKYRQFDETWFWKKHAPLFASIGLPILQPVMGCSEVLNQTIVEHAGYGNFAQSCLRAEAGDTCGQCWKCFRKNSLRGHDILISREIDTFLSKERLKMAASTIYSIQKMEAHVPKLYERILDTYDNINALVLEDVSFLEEYHSPALSLIPPKYKNFVQERLDHFDLKVTENEAIKEFCLYD